ncbi:MAG: RluA family pseudouridine synthase, partial [Thermodesulfobacteriota bacterium]
MQTKLVVLPENSGLRLDKFLALQLDAPDLSRAVISKWIKQGRAKVNGQVCLKPKKQLNPGDEVEITPEEISGRHESVPGSLDIKYQDKEMLVLNKPASISVHPAPSESDTTLVNFLLYRFPELEDLDPERPGIVHRLDKDTSGLMLVGRTSRAVEKLSRDIANRKLHKEYLAIVHGVPEAENGKITLPIGRDPGSRSRMKVLPEQGREAYTYYSVLHVFPDNRFSLLQVRIITGRTHQIRVHLSHLGFPVLGDSLYGSHEFTLLKNDQPLLAGLTPRQMLHSWKIGFNHPYSGNWMDFVQPIPRDFKRVLLQLQKTGLKVGILGSQNNGKSLLLHNLEQRGIEVFKDGDAFCEYFDTGADGWEMFKRTLGEKFFTSSGNYLDKQKIISSMQASQSFREEVLAILKPLLDYWLQQITQMFWKKNVFAADIPAFCDAVTDLHQYFDLLVYVYEPNIVEKQSRECSNPKSHDTVGAFEDMLPTTQKLANTADLVICGCSEASEMKRKSVALENILLQIKRNRLKKFFNQLCDS